MGYIGSTQENVTRNCQPLGRHNQFMWFTKRIRNIAETEKNTLSCNTINQKTKKLVLRKLPWHSLGWLGFIGECNFRSSSVSCQTSDLQKNDKWAAFKPPFHWLLSGEDLYISGRGYIYLLKIQLKPVPKSNAILGGGRATHSKHPLLIFGKFPQEGTKLTMQETFFQLLKTWNESKGPPRETVQSTVRSTNCSPRIICHEEVIP